LNLRHIVVATDESDAGRHAVRAGLELAARAAARLTVMRAVSVRAIPLLGAMAGDADATELDGAGAALERLQRWLEVDVIPTGAGVPVGLGIAFGVPGVEICRFAEQCEADLLVLGRKQRSPLARLLVGDTADAVIRRSSVPCLFVQPGSGPIREMLVALDGTEQGMHVSAATRGFARSVGAAMRVVTVEDQEASPALMPAVALTRSIRLQPENPEVAVRRGSVVREILAEVVESRTDVLAFGYHRSGPPGIIEGSSTARQLAHTAPVSVLAIPL